MKPVYLFFSALLVIGCSDDELTKDQFKERSGNSDLVMAFEGDARNDELGMNIKKAKVWRSKSNTDAAGVVTLIDLYSVELWFTLDSDSAKSTTETTDVDKDEVKPPSLVEDEESAKPVRYWNSGVFKSTDDGFLYEEAESPGITRKTLNPRSPAVGKEGFVEYTIDKTNGLLSLNTSAQYLSTQTLGKDGDLKTTNKLLNISDIKDSGWEKVKHFGDGPAIVSHTYFSKNEGLEIKKKLGCLVKPVNSEGERLSSEFLFGDVELGDTLVHTNNGSLTFDSEYDIDKLGDDDEIYIEWTDTFHLAGVNWQTRSFRLNRYKTAPFYGNRELVGVDSSDSSGKPSGINSLVKKCNDKAGADGGTFQMLNLVRTSTAAGPSLNSFGSEVPFCQELKDLKSFAKENLSDIQFGCSGFPLATPFWRGGTFDGNEHTSPVENVTSNINHFEMTDIVEILLE